MKLLIAVDGSPSSTTAVELVAGLDWPQGTQAHVMTVFDTVRLAGPWAGMLSIGLGDLGVTVLEELTGVVDRAATRLREAGLLVEHRVLTGRPATVVLDEAQQLGVDLIVVGSRGLGPFRTMLLGSVSAEVVDGAPCPVLVTRTAAIDRVLLAHDGSDEALAAEEALLALAPLAAAPIEVLSVVRAPEPGADVFALGMVGALDAYDTAVEEARLDHQRIARDAVERLERAGRSATWSVLAGDPARTIVAEAESRGAGLIAMGTHGRTGLDRITLGSVARNVLTHAHGSVLVARGARRVDQKA